jgi:hypothetical protein
VLQRDLRAWFVNLLGPGLPLPEPPLLVTADGDAYRVSLPLDGVTGRTQDEITARLRKLDDGRWSVDPLRFPRSGAFSVPSPDPGIPDAISAVTLSIGEQASRAVIDPALTSRSTLDLEFRGVDLTGIGGGQTHKQSIDRSTFRATLIPGADKRIDITQEGEFTDWRSSVASDGGSETSMEVRRVRLNSRVEGLRRDGLDAAFGAVKAMLAQATTDKPDRGVPLSPAMRAHLRALVTALRDVATRLQGEETLDDISVEVPGIGTVSLDQARFGMGAEAPDGKLRAWMDVDLAGPAVPDLPPNLAKYLPTRLAMRPAVSGISTDRVFQLALEATEETADQKKLEVEALALLADPAATIGLEALSLEMSGVRVEGSARLRMFATDTIGMEGRLSATGMEALMGEAGKDPALQLAMPFLVMIRGLARAEGDRLVWDMAITKDQALVNGVDVMSMAAQPPPSKGSQPKRPNNR